MAQTQALKDPRYVNELSAFSNAGLFFAFSLRAQEIRRTQRTGAILSARHFGGKNKVRKKPMCCPMAGVHAHPHPVN
jgi:hypothetical protein